MESNGAARATRHQSKRIRVKTQAACNRCRQSRIKCNALRPSCSSCTVAGNVCEYDTIDPSESRFSALRRDNAALQEQLAEMAKSLDWLKSLPAQEAQKWLQCLKFAQNPVELLLAVNSAMSGGAQTAGLMSSQQALSACLTPRTSLADIELAEETPAVYPLTDPEVYSGLLDFLWTDSVGEQPSVENSETANPSADVSSAWSQPATKIAPHGPSAQSVPRLNFALYDSRLHALTIDYWTTVPISNRSAAMIISLYLQYEHDGFAFFDPDLFVRDLVERRTAFCSPLLVNSLLSWACRTYGFVDAKSSLLGSMFFERAQELLQEERKTDSLLTVASLGILGLGSNGGGYPVVAATCLVGCVQMAERMGLLGENRLPAEAFGFASDEVASAYTWIAWGAFSISVIETWYFRGKRIGMLATHPPLLPFPCRRNENPEYYQPYAEHIFYVTPAFCGLWTILHEVLTVYHEDYAPVVERVPLSFAEAKFSQLLAWSRALPQSLARKDDMPHNVAMLHICFHAIVTDIFRPFRHLFTQSLDFHFQYRVGDIFDCSAAQLRSLTLDFHSRYRSTPATHSVSWITGILWGANGTMMDLRENQRNYIVFFLQASANLLSSHPVMDRFIRGLLSMAVSAGVLSISQARKLLKRLKRTITENTLGEAGWVTDLNLAMDNPKSAVADVLAQQFDEMTLEHGSSP